MIDDIEWRVSDGLVPYDEAVAWMDARATAIGAGEAAECIWLLEHPPTYTAGTSASADELLDPPFPVVKAGRGGRHTYHGPGQRVGYVMLDLGKRGRDVRCYVHALEGWVITALAEFGIAGRRASGRVGIWVDAPEGEAKIGAIGVRVRRWVTLHGFAVNLDPDLSHFAGIVPCGIAEFGVTSAAALGRPISRDDFDAALKKTLPNLLSVIPAQQSA